MNDLEYYLNHFIDVEADIEIVKRFIECAVFYVVHVLKDLTNGMSINILNLFKAGNKY